MRERNGKETKKKKWKGKVEEQKGIETYCLWLS